MPAPEHKPANIYLAPAHLNHIRATIDWQEMFRGLNLRQDKRKSKTDDWWAFSPFKDEKTASFHMGPGGVWYDFSVGMGGGPIELVQRIYSLNCYEAANLILERGWARSALDIQNTRLETQARVKAVQSEAQTHQNDPIRQNLLPMCTYHDYLVQRGLSEETCRALGIGYLPQGRSPLRGRMIFQIRDERLNEKTSERETVTLSHMGRAIDGKTKPKYLFYEGFHKSAELYAQDIIWRDPKAKQQIADTGYLVLTEGPFDVAKAYESGLRNVVASFGANLSNRQAELLESICHQRGASSILVAYDRDKSGRDGIEKARAKLESLGVPTHVFDWDIRLSINDGRRVSIPRSIGDIADFSVDQLKWLRRKRLI